VKIDWAFLRLVLYYAVGVAVVIVFPLSAVASREVLDSVIASGIVSLLHLLLGYAAIVLGFDKSNTVFLKIVLGGTVIRIFLLVGIVVVLVRVYHFQTLSLMLSLSVFYILNLVLEISFLQKKVALKS
jgi:uncharacterized membrane protein YqjE